MQLLSLYATPRRVKIVIYGNSVKYEEENSKKYTKSLLNKITTNHSCESIIFFQMRYGSLPSSKKWLNIIKK